MYMYKYIYEYVYIYIYIYIRIHCVKKKQGKRGKKEDRRKKVHRKQ